MVGVHESPANKQFGPIPHLLPRFPAACRHVFQGVHMLLQFSSSAEGVGRPWREGEKRLSKVRGGGGGKGRGGGGGWGGAADWGVGRGGAGGGGGGGWGGEMGSEAWWKGAWHVEHVAVPRAVRAKLPTGLGHVL